MINLLNAVTTFFLMIIYYLLIFGFPVTAALLHLWTTYIAFTEGGFWGGVISLFLPVVSEVYWMFKMFGVNNLFAWLTLLHLILALPASALRKEYAFTKRYSS